MELFKIDGLEYFNTGEADIGNIKISGNNIKIPVFNLQIINNNHTLLKKSSSTYLRFSYLCFDNVKSIIWNYEIKECLNLSQECYGGTCFFDNEYYEFWIIYDKGYILTKEFITSKIPHNLKIEDENELYLFFDSSPIL